MFGGAQIFGQSWGEGVRHEVLQWSSSIFVNLVVACLVWYCATLFLLSNYNYICPCCSLFPFYVDC